MFIDPAQGLGLQQWGLAQQQMVFFIPNNSAQICLVTLNALMVILDQALSDMTHTTNVPHIQVKGLYFIQTWHKIKHVNIKDI